MSSLHFLIPLARSSRRVVRLYRHRVKGSSKRIRKNPELVRTKNIVSKMRPKRRSKMPVLNSKFSKTTKILP